MKKIILMLTALTIVILLAGLIPQINSWFALPKMTEITGENLNSLESPNGAATDDEHVYIANSEKNQISVFNLKGQYQFPIGSYGENDGELQYPVDVEVYEDKVFVADLGNNRIQVFTKTGQFLDLFPRERNIKPAAISVKSERIYVSDIYSQTIKVYSLTGKLLQEFGEAGKGKGQLNYANGLAVSESGEVIVSDTQNQRIQVFSPEGRFEREPLPKKQLGLPKGMAADSEELFLADALHQAVYSITLDGKSSSRVKVDAPLEFPTDVYLSEKHIVITDNGSNKVLIIRREGGRK